jgi:microcystin-dependent protein
MNSPVVPSDFLGAVPSTNATLCGKFQAALLRLPVLVHKVVQFIFNFDGSLNSSFIAQIHQPGDLIFSAAPLAISNDRLRCNGQEVSKTIYAALYAAIGDIYGTAPYTAPSNPNNFKVPDMGGRSPVGVGLCTAKYTDINGVVTNSTFSPTLGASDGEDVHALRANEGAQDRQHYHTVGKFIGTSGSLENDLGFFNEGTSFVQAGDALTLQEVTGADTPKFSDTDTADGVYAFTGPVDNAKDYNWIAKTKKDFDGHNNMSPYLGVYVYIATGGITYANSLADPNYND